jgi:NTP pyrophosphatase (non-canonical NTP hydrolase)
MSAVDEELDLQGRPAGMTGSETLAWYGIRHAQALAHQTSRDAGWYNDPMTGDPVVRNFGEVVALMHSELSEALEADRKGLKDDKLPHRDGREVEFADCIIRILDTAEALGLDVAGALIEKNRFNMARVDHKLASRAQDGGKKY